MKHPRIIIAGTNSGAGKTTVTLGLILAMRKAGLKVQPFKTGPDYIDPSYHTEAAGRVCRNLDSWLFPEEAVLELFQKNSAGADISVIEGVMGLFDGVKDSEEGSTAHLAKILRCPVILVLNARSMSRSAAAVVMGYKSFDSGVDVAGVILNNVGSENHYRYLRSAIESKTKVPVLGRLPKMKEIEIPERHLGLVPAQERKRRKSFLKGLAKLADDNIDIEKILEIARRATALPDRSKKIFSGIPAKKTVTIAVAKDEAFNFYYQDNLDILSHHGARLVEFSPLRDKGLPRNIDGVYIGGGFPELFARGLSQNKSLKEDIRVKAKNGMPVYAECGGLMYLVEKLADLEGKEFRMAGVLKGSVRMAAKRQALGYVDVETLEDNVLTKKGEAGRAHVFHWSYLDGDRAGTAPVFKVCKGKDNVVFDGLTDGNVLASYAHFHFASNIRLAKNFIENCEINKGSRVKGQGSRKKARTENREPGTETGVIILCHGSKLKKANDSVKGTIGAVRKNTGLRLIAPAYLQLASPSLSESVRGLVRKGCGKIIIVPFFLFVGNHVSRDIPGAIEKEKAAYPLVDFVYTDNLGGDERLAEIVADRIGGVCAGNNRSERN